MFIGLNDLSEEGNWVFSNGDEFDDQIDWTYYYVWNGTHNVKYQQPDNGGNIYADGVDQDCGMLYFGDGYYLYDEECNELRYFICEFVN